MSSRPLRHDIGSGSIEDGEQNAPEVMPDWLGYPAQQDPGRIEDPQGLDHRNVLRDNILRIGSRMEQPTRVEGAELGDDRGAEFGPAETDLGRQVRVRKIYWHRDDEEATLRSLSAGIESGKSTMMSNSSSVLAGRYHGQPSQRGRFGKGLTWQALVACTHGTRTCPWQVLRSQPPSPATLPTRRRS